MDLTRACASDYLHKCVCHCAWARARVCVRTCTVCIDIKNTCVRVGMVYVCACVCVLPLDEFFICTVLGMQSHYTSLMIIQVR